jgi:hypothetical protein
MTKPHAAHHYKRHRFPAEIIAHAVWLYYRFPLSLRHVEDLLVERGIEVFFQMASEWASKFGSDFCPITSSAVTGAAFPINGMAVLAPTGYLLAALLEQQGVGALPPACNRREAWQMPA